MKTILLLLLTVYTHCLYAQDSTNRNIIFYDDFTDNKNGWDLQETKHMKGSITNGCYYLTSKGHAYGDSKQIAIDTKKDFAIETSIKFIEGGSDYKNYNSMLFWGRDSLNAYYFTFAKDGKAGVLTCAGISSGSCITQEGSLQKTNISPVDFNKFTIRKIKKTYYFLVNDVLLYQMPFVPFFGNTIGVGAGRKSTLAIDYLRVVYL